MVVKYNIEIMLDNRGKNFVKYFGEKIAMNWEYFLIHTDIIKERGLDIGFKLYGAGHLIWLAAIIVGIILWSGYYKTLTEGTQARVRKFFAVAILLSEIIKDAILIYGDAPMKGSLPLHLCGLAIFVMLADAFLDFREITGQMLTLAFMPGACAALLFCNWTEYPFFNFMNIHSFVFHAWIICYVIMIYRNGEARPEYKGLWKVIGMIAVIAVPIYFVNKALEENYLFISEASEGSPLVFLWDIFGTRFGEIGYIASYGVFVITVLHVLFVVYTFTNKRVKNR